VQVEDVAVALGPAPGCEVVAQVAYCPFLSCPSDPGPHRCSLPYFTAQVGLGAPPVGVKEPVGAVPWDRNLLQAGADRVGPFLQGGARPGEPRASDALQRLSETTRASGTDWAIGTEARSRALLSEGETAEKCYREAIERLGRTRMRPALARAHLLFGEWLRGENRRGDARAELRTAHGLFTTMGIEAFAERARRELLATGDTVRKRTAETVSELTAQEAYIARLAVDGRTNVEIGAQLFLSTRTVEWHLSKVYSKLGVGSRRELRRALASLGQADPQT
jgi:DNA-binding CsgD family transcriptional regulator